MNLRNRLEFHEYLKKNTGCNNLYYQPPENIKINYPAIIYNVKNIKNKHANNSVYLQNKSYKITIIDEDQDSSIYEKLTKLPKVEPLDIFVSNNLYHFVLNIYV